MKIDHPELDASLTIPDADDITIRQVLKYDSALEALEGEPFYFRLWESAKTWITEWETDIFDLDSDFEDAYDAESIMLVKWAGLAVFSLRQALDSPEKN